MKKLRGLKRKWRRMFEHLETLAHLNGQEDEIFIAESFSYYKRKITQAHQAEVFDKLVAILRQKQRTDSSREYLLWYLPEDVFESSIYMFPSLFEVQKFFNERNANRTDSDHYLLTVAPAVTLPSYLVSRIEEPIEAISVKARLKAHSDETKVVLIANEKLIHVAKRELN